MPRGGTGGLPWCSVCQDRVVADLVVDLAVDLCLDYRRGTSPDGLSERYLYSADMQYRYAFGRWWGQEDLANTVVWVLLNPATGDTTAEETHVGALHRLVSRRLQRPSHCELVRVPGHGSQSSA